MLAGDTRIVIAIRDLFARTVLRTVFSLNGILVLAEAAAGEDLVSLCDDIEPDVLVSDLCLEDGDIDHLIPAIADTGTAVLVLSDDRSPERFTSVLESGASGYLLYDTGAEAVVDAVRAVGSGAAALDPAAARTVLYQWRTLRARDVGPTGARPLTNREMDVLEAMVDGLTAKEIARRLGVAVKTVENHKLRIFEKLSVHTHAQAVSVAIGEGLLAGRSTPQGPS